MNGARVGRLRLHVMVEVTVTGVMAVVRDARVESFSMGSYEGTVALYCEELLVDEEKVFEDSVSGTNLAGGRSAVPGRRAPRWRLTATPVELALGPWTIRNRRGTKRRVTG